MVTCCCLGSALGSVQHLLVQPRKQTSKVPSHPSTGMGCSPPRFRAQGAPQQLPPGGRGAPGAEEGSSCWGRGQRWPGSPVPLCQPLAVQGAAMSPSPGGAPCGEGSFPSDPSSPLATHSLVSRVMMMRMGLLFIPPTQLLLHMKLYRMVVNSVPTCPEGRAGAEQGGMGGRGRLGPLDPSMGLAPWQGEPGSTRDSPSWEERDRARTRGPWGPPWYGDHAKGRWSPFAPHFPGVGCSGMLHSAGSCRCSNSCHQCGSKHGWPSVCQGKQDAPALRLLPCNPIHSRFTTSTSRSPAGGRGCPLALGAAGYLRGLVGHHHTLPSRHRVVHVLGEVVAFHADEVTGRGRLPCKRETPA